MTARPADKKTTRKRKPGTKTSAFGVSRRENHDAGDFYRRFPTLEVVKDETVNVSPVQDQIIVGDSTKMVDLVDSSVGLVVTSPPYFAGKDYEQALGQGGVPADYIEYLTMLRDVFAECLRVMEPGARIAVNVANLGRKPFRSLSGDVTDILQDLGFLLRGEVVWIKAEGASGSTAWGSYGMPTNPVMRDVTERIVIASKQRFERAIHWKKRQEQGLPWEGTISKADFQTWTLDTWRMQPAQAKRIGHPAPFPVELPHRLIQLFTFKDDLILDPFMGSGQTAIAALQDGRHYVGYDTDADYVAHAETRIAQARQEHEAGS